MLGLVFQAQSQETGSEAQVSQDSSTANWDKLVPKDSEKTPIQPHVKTKQYVHFKAKEILYLVKEQNFKLNIKYCGFSLKNHHL